MDYGHDNNNFVVDITDAPERMGEIERNIKIRMAKRDDIMR